MCDGGGCYSTFIVNENVMQGGLREDILSLGALDPDRAGDVIGIGGTAFSDEARDTTVEDVDLDDIVSMVLIVEDRLGVGKPLNEEKSQDMDFFGVGLVLASDEATEGGTGGRSL